LLGLCCWLASPDPGPFQNVSLLLLLSLPHRLKSKDIEVDLWRFEVPDQPDPALQPQLQQLSLDGGGLEGGAAADTDADSENDSGSEQAP
jgi:hypothetical protein